jgi:hypothetical protein
VPQVESWFNTCAGTIYRERMIFLGGVASFLKYAICIAGRAAYIDAYISVKIDRTTNCKALYYMEPAGGIEPPTY